ncbi:mRNA-binding ribosome synthesis protein nop7 [Trichoglossum hirsutum]|uniref:Pescadillo homolog n=1 Tax=Trichoglossum hirsutum TaxID=265104 RepID=A0A9P8LCC0_9PEZI|nr:mRNA-binding ribosome synthesis protein nop7 [Trichoglossum hirsutum]
MAKIKKKGTSGQARNFITRTQAVRKLQISLPDFRRLCIFKGIYPREPRNKKKVSKSSTPSTTFYYTKDIQYLLHEPVLRKFREHKAFAKKLSRALGRGDVSTAARLEKTAKPSITLDHIVKERYPTFVDALRDLDDALSMLFLFANLPSTSTVAPKTISLCERLCLEFEHYLIASHSLRKSFLSIKGIYYQATIQGQDILWLVPYKFAQKVTGDVDFRIMGTFVEFYATLLGFVNFRLYTSIGLVYPPKFDRKSDDSGGELGAFTLEGRGVGGTLASTAQTNGSAENNIATISSSKQQKQLESIAERIASLPTPSSMESEHDPESANMGATPPSPGKPLTELVPVDTIDTFEPPIAADADVLDQPDLTADDGLAHLFASFTFYLSRETPRQPLEFLLRSFGCKRLGWDSVLGDGAFTNNEADPSITHQVVDRPPLPPTSLPPLPEAGAEDEISSTSVRPGSRIPGRIYVQPQWIWDCVNAGKLLRPDLYAPGAILPPHLSPWVKLGEREYDPTAPLAGQEREGEEEDADSEESDEDVGGDGDEGGGKTAPRIDKVNGKAIPGKIAHVDVEVGEGMDIAGSEPSEDGEEKDEYHDEEWEGFDDDAESESESEAEASRSQYQRELEAEAAGLPFSSVAVGPQDTADAKKKSREDARKKAARKRREEEEELERAKMMMSRKKRKLLDKMLYSNRKKDEEAETLRRKRRKIERNGGVK